MLFYNPSRLSETLISNTNKLDNIYSNKRANANQDFDLSAYVCLGNGAQIPKTPFVTGQYQ